MYTYTGTIKSISNTQKVSEKFQKREFTVTDNAQSFPQVIQFELTQERCDILDNITEGEEVHIQFHVMGREWKNPQGIVRVFNTLQAVSVVKTIQYNNQSPSSIDQDELPVQSKEAFDSRKNQLYTSTPDDDLSF